MKIVQLDIQGFRSLRNVSWRPGDLNVVIGPNGSGKSNLLRMLELISAAAQGHLTDYVMAAGGMGAIVWDGESPNIVFQADFASSHPSKLVQSYRVDFAHVGRGSSFRVDLENYIADDTYMRRNQGNSALVKSKGGEPSHFGNDVIRENETALAILAAPLGGFRGLSAFQNVLSEWFVYQDVRTDQNAPIRQAPVSRLEQQIAPDGQNLINVLHTLYTSDRKFKQDVNDAMQAAFGDDFDELIFPPDAGDQRIQMRVRWKTLKREQSTADLSDGTLRFLFLITVLASPNPPPLVAIDEPETGLHPSMLPIIAEFAMEASKRTQVIFTTHSDQFLDAFRDTRPTTTVAKWEDGETTLTTLDDAELAYWLQDYTLGKLFRSGELENMAA